MINVPTPANMAAEVTSLNHNNKSTCPMEAKITKKPDGHPTNPRHRRNN